MAAEDRSNWDFLDMEVVSRLSKLTLSVRMPMLGSVQGLHRSATRGASVEFAEYRKYVPGDDLKFMDWRVFARSDRFYMKEFEADTNLRCYLVVDTSASMKFTTGKRTRFDVARSIAATLAHLLINQGDAAGLCCVTDKLHHDLPPRRNPRHLRQILNLLAQSEPQGETNLIQTLHDLAERVRQRSLVIIISDLMTEVPGLLGCFKHLRFYKHDVAVFHLLDRQEYDFDFTRPVRFVDMENGSELITDTAVIRDAYRDAVNNYLTALSHGCREYGVDYRLSYLDQGYEGALTSFMLQRLGRGKGGR